MIQSQLRVTEEGKWLVVAIHSPAPVSVSRRLCCEHHPHMPIRQEHLPSWSVTKAFSPIENSIHLETMYSPHQNTCLWILLREHILLHHQMQNKLQWTAIVQKPVSYNNHINSPPIHALMKTCPYHCSVSLIIVTFCDPGVNFWC